MTEKKVKDKESLPTRVVQFIRETVSELRRVVWPTREQVVTYTIVVLVFVTFMSLLVSAIDLLVGRGVLVIFGS
jgi:preprotein translocase subunit SecE